MCVLRREGGKEKVNEKEDEGCCARAMHTHTHTEAGHTTLTDTD